MFQDNISDYVFLDNDTVSTRYGPLQFVDKLPALAIILIIVLIIAALVGTLGNLLILVAVATTKDLQNVESVFVVNLACSDMYVTLIADPLSIVGKTAGWEFFASVPGLCQAVGSLCTISCIGSLATLSAMACNRYVLIVHPHYYRIIFTLRNSLIMCFSFYIVGLLLVCLNFLGIGDHSFDHKSLECIWDRMANHNYTIVFAIVLVWVPILVTGLAYSRLYLHVKKARMKVHNHAHKGHSVIGGTSTVAGREESSVYNKMSDKEDKKKFTPAIELEPMFREKEQPGIVESGVVNALNPKVPTTQLGGGRASAPSIQLNGGQYGDQEVNHFGSEWVDHDDTVPSIHLHESRRTSALQPPKEDLQVKTRTPNGTTPRGHVLVLVKPVAEPTTDSHSPDDHISKDHSLSNSTTKDQSFGKHLTVTHTATGLSMTSDQPSNVSSYNAGKPSSQDPNASFSSRASQNHAFKLARTLFFIYLVFSVCWLPFSLLLILDARDTFAHELHVVIVAWAHLHPSINWLVYYHTHSKFRKAFRRILHLDLCCR